MVMRSVSALTISGWHFVSYYPTDFRNLSDHWSIKLHQHDKMANYDGDSSMIHFYFFLYIHA